MEEFFDVHVTINKDQAAALGFDSSAAVNVHFASAILNHVKAKSGKTLGEIGLTPSFRTDITD